LIPKYGPNDGSRKHNATFFPNARNPSANPIDVVVFPSPAGVGVIADTNINAPSGLPARLVNSSIGTFAMYRPCSRISSGSNPSSAATCPIRFTGLPLISPWKDM
jgi:hypothetical protein